MRAAWPLSPMVPSREDAPLLAAQVNDFSMHTRLTSALFYGFAHSFPFGRRKAYLGHN